MNVELTESDGIRKRDEEGRQHGDYQVVANDGHLTVHPGSEAVKQSRDG